MVRPRTILTSVSGSLAWSLGWSVSKQVSTQAQGDAALWLKAKQNLPKPPQIFFVYFQENQYIMNHRYVEVPTITFLSDFL